VGDTNEEKLNKEDSFTLLNAVDKTQKMWIVLYATFTVGFGGHIFVYMFETAVKVAENFEKE